MGVMPGKSASATAVVVTHNSAPHIGPTLEALIADPEGPERIVVVDTASTDDTASIVAGYPVEWIGLIQNVGYGAAANVAAARVDTDHLVVLTHDVVVTPGWLGPLEAALADPTVGAVMPTVELADRPGRLNTSGGAISFSGLAWVTDLGEAIPDDEPDAVEVPFPSGAAFAVRTDVWRRIGGFRDDFFMYHEDTDLGWRLRLAGLRVLRVPGSRVAHRYEFSRHGDKLRLLERNRLRMLLTNYRRSTLALLAPVLLLHETGVVWVALRDGWFRRKAAAWAQGLVGNRRRYRQVQATRAVGDADILRSMSTRVTAIPIPEVRVPRGSRVVDAVAGGYVRAVLPLVRALDRRRLPR
jgi:GT2 family glycosyltransferase